MNSRQKGVRGEREWRDQLREQGWQARRGQQFSGGDDSPDVVCKSLPYHFEVKRVEKLNLQDAVDQASRDCGGKPWVVAHRRNDHPWLVTMRADEWFRLVKESNTGLPAASVGEKGTP